MRPVISAAKCDAVIGFDSDFIVAGWHVVPHAPQLLGSCSLLMHVPLQLSSPVVDGQHTVEAAPEPLLVSATVPAGHAQPPV